MEIGWGLSGGAAAAIALFRQAEVVLEKGYIPNVIIGTSSGSLVAPIVAVAVVIPCLLQDAIKFAETLNVSDMFPYKGNKPFTKKSKPTPMAILRALRYNHLGWQDIKPMYKKVFKEEHFKILQKSSIKCYTYSVVGKNWTPTRYCLNDAKSIDDMIDMIETSSRVVPFVQPMEYNGNTYVDGGFDCFNPGWTLFEDHELDVLVTMHTNNPLDGIGTNDKYDKNILSITTQAMTGITNRLAVKDVLLSRAYAKVHSTKLIELFAPTGYIDEMYETDDSQLIALGLASKSKANKILNKIENIIT